jgi:hypothetical protein
MANVSESPEKAAGDVRREKEEGVSMGGGGKRGCGKRGPQANLAHGGKKASSTTFLNNSMQMQKQEKPKITLDERYQAKLSVLSTLVKEVGRCRSPAKRLVVLAGFGALFSVVLLAGVNASAVGYLAVLAIFAGTVAIVCRNKPNG